MSARLSFGETGTNPYLLFEPYEPPGAIYAFLCRFPLAVPTIMAALAGLLCLINV